MGAGAQAAAACCMHGTRQQQQQQGADLAAQVLLPLVGRLRGAGMAGARPEEGRPRLINPKAWLPTALLQPSAEP